MSETQNPSLSEQTKPMAGLTGHLRIAIWTFLVSAFGVLLHEVGLVWYYSSLASGGFDASEASVLLFGIINLLGIFGIGYLIGFVWVVIMVCRWSFRAMKNLRIRGVETDISPTMAVVWYFIPFANLWMPFAATKEIWRASLDPTGQDAPPIPAIMGWWWALWIVANFLANAANRLLGVLEQTTDLDRLIWGNGLSVSSSILLIVAAVLMLRFMPRISRAQDDHNTDGLEKVFS